MNNPETIIRGIIKEAVMTSSGVEGDYEGDMARGELQAIIANAQDLLSQIEEKTELEAWVQSKITKAADYISSVRNYMQGQQHRMQSSGIHEQKNAIVKAVASHVGSTNPKKVKAHFAHDEKAAKQIEKLAGTLEEEESKPGPNDPKGQTVASRAFASAMNKGGLDKDLKKLTQQFRTSRAVQQEPIKEESKGLKEACWSGYMAKGTKNKGGRTVPNCVPIEEAKSEAWQRKEGKDPEGGLNEKGVASYRRANPGSKLQTAVTTEPSKLKPGSKKAKRRKSFCSRMKGMKAKLTSAKTARDPDSRINKSLRKWNCE